MQQVQIVHLEYPGRIQPEHLEEMKHDHFYKGLNPEYRWMLARKVNGEHPSSYSNLLLATWKLEQAEARDPLPQKMAVTNGLTTMCSQILRNLFPSCKLMGNCTFASQAVTIGNYMAEEDPDVEPEGEEETEPSANEK